MNECELYLRPGGPISYGAVILRGNIEGLGEQNSLFPVEPVIKCLMSHITNDTCIEGLAESLYSNEFFSRVTF